MERRWLKFSALALLWAFVGLLLSVEVYFNLRASMKDEVIMFWPVAEQQFVRAVMWAFMAPFSPSPGNLPF